MASAEQAVEVVNVGNATAFGDFLQGQLCLAQHAGRRVHACLETKLAEGKPGRRAKQPTEVNLRDAAGTGDLGLDPIVRRLAADVGDQIL